MGRLLSSIVYLITLNNSPIASYKYIDSAYAWIANAKETRDSLGGNLGVDFINIYRCNDTFQACEVFNTFELR
jgi:hypothetical protein